MNTKVLIPLAKNKNRCISCVYLCRGVGNTLSEWEELYQRTRFEIIEEQWAKSNYQYLRCCKGLRTPQELERNVRTAICPSKGWRPHIDDKPPEMSFQHEQSSKAHKWIIVGVIISSVILASTLFFGILNLVSC